MRIGHEEGRTLFAKYVDQYVKARPEEEHSQLLNRLREIAEKEFDGRVIRNMTSIVYVAQKIS